MFSLDFKIPVPSKLIDLKDQITLMGSCFSDNIGRKLIENKFNAHVNPAGTIYNPISIFSILSKAVTKNAKTSLVENQAIWYDWNFHSDISSISKLEQEKSVQAAFDAIKNLVLNSKWIIVTPGTAWIYRLKDSQEIVANCHRIPSTYFQKELLEVDQIIEAFETLHIETEKVNPNLNWLFTISPVRHIRDGLIENNQSKAILIESIRRIVQKKNNAYYFPSYEIVIDQLRDYRYFTKDLVHPNELAIDYIWEQFLNNNVNQNSRTTLKKWEQTASILQHRPRHPNSEQHQKLIKDTLLKLNELSADIDVSKEIEYLKKSLIE